ncbi:MAG: hypothetical protein ACK5D5_13045 [Bacteroidota bacterium]
MYRFSLLFIILIAIFLRVYSPLPGCFWADSDEFYTVKTISFLNEDIVKRNVYYEYSDIKYNGIRKIIENASRDNGNNFIYNLILSMVSLVLKPSDYWLRVFSAICDLISILMIIKISRLYQFSRLSVLISILLFSICPILVTYGYIIRAYSFAVTITFISFYFFSIVNISSGSSRKHWWFFSISCIFLFLSHYLSFYIILIYFFFFFLNRSTTDSLNKGRMLYSFLGIIFFVSMYLFLNAGGINKIITISKNRQELSNESKTNNNYKSLGLSNFKTATENYVRYFFSGIRKKEDFNILFGPGLLSKAVSIIGLILFSYWLYYVFSNYKNRDVVMFGLFSFAGFFLSIILALISGHLTSLSVKYSIFSLPFLILLIGGFIFRTRSLKLIPISILGFNFLFTTYLIVKFRNEYKSPVFNVLASGRTSLDRNLIGDSFFEKIDSFKRSTDTIYFPDHESLAFFCLTSKTIINESSVIIVTETPFIKMHRNGSEFRAKYKLIHPY